MKVMSLLVQLQGIRNISKDFNDESFIVINSDIMDRLSISKNLRDINLKTINLAHISIS